MASVHWVGGWGGAPRGAVGWGGGGGREVGLEPFLLRRAGGGGDAAVEHHDVPIPQVVAVVELSGVARGGPEILPVRGRPGAEPLHVADGGTGGCLVTTTRGVIAVDEVRRI